MRSCHAHNVANSLGYPTIEALIIDKRADRWPYDKIIEFTGLPERTIFNHLPQDLKGDFSAMTEKRRKHIQKLIVYGSDARRRKRFTELRRDGTTRKELSIMEMDKVRARLAQKKQGGL